MKPIQILFQGVSQMFIERSEDILNVDNSFTVKNKANFKVAKHDES